MQISTTSIISLLIWGNITIIILCVLCSVPKIFNKMNFRFMISLLTIVFIRFLYPFEITSITQAIPLKGHFFKIVNFIRETDLNFFERTIYIYQILLFLWFSMALFLLLKIVFKYIVYKRNLKDVILERNKPVEPDMLAFNIPQNLIIYVSDAIVTPAITGIIHPIILLPDLTLSQQELKLIFQHELQHYKFKDTLLKICIEIFCVIYWWNPFMYVLKKQLLFLLEIRADSYVYEHLVLYPASNNSLHL